MIYARYRECLGTSGACAHEYGVEAAGKQIVDGKRTAYGGVEMEQDSEILYFFDFASDNFFWESVFRYAEHQYSSRLGLHLEYLHTESLARKIACDSESGRSAADYGHCAARFLRYSLVGKSGLSVEVGYEALEFSNIYMLAFFGKHTVALALAFMAAYASAYSRQIAARVDYFHSVAKVSFGKFGNPVGYVV